MQPGALDDAQAVFDDYIETIQLLAVELDGIILDHHRDTADRCHNSINSAEFVNLKRMQKAVKCIPASFIYTL